MVTPQGCIKLDGKAEEACGLDVRESYVWVDPGEQYMHIPRVVSRFVKAKKKGPRLGDLKGGYVKPATEEQIVVAVNSGLSAPP